MNHYPDPALARTLVEHQDFVQRLALRLTRDPAEADDVAQDTWVRALESRPSTEKGLRPWLESSLRGISRNRRRAAQRRRTHEGAAARPEVSPVQMLALRHEVVEAVLALDEPYRKTVVMAYEMGLSPGEIAEKEGIQPGTVRTRLHRAHGKLRARLVGGEDGRERLAALAVPAAWQGRRVAAISTSQVLSVATVVVGLSAGAWTLWGGEGATLPIVERAVVTAAALPGDPSPAPEPAPSLAPLPPREDDLTPNGASRRALEPSPTVESPYWEAVRKARRGIPRFRVEESEASASLRARVATLRLAAPPVSTADELPAVIRAIAAQHGVPLRVTEAAATELSAALSPQWIVAPADMTLECWLKLVLAVHGPNRRGEGVQWDVLDDAVVIATLTELLARAGAFDHRIDDLLIESKLYFEGGVVPSPIYERTADLDDLFAALTDGMAEFYSEDVEAAPVTSPPAIRWRHTPRHQLRVQAFLDQLRGFRQPLPGEGVCGQRFRSVGSEGNARVLAALGAVGGPGQLLSEGEIPLEERLRRLGTRHRIGVLWSASARELRSTPQRLGVEVLQGTLLVLAADESTHAPRSVLWLDLRSQLDDQAITSDQIASDPNLQALAEAGAELTWTASLVAEYVRRFIAPETWDQDPRNSLRVTQESQLIVHHDPWVLDEIERSVDRLIRGRPTPHAPR